MSSDRDLADLIDVERHLEDTTAPTWSGDTASVEAPARNEDEDEIDSLMMQRFHSYRATGHLGSGACAHVLRGDHIQLSRSVAIKVLKPRYLGSHVMVERMKREAEALIELRHPNVVECYEFGSLPTGLPFLILELIPGRTLLDVVTREGPLSSDAVVAVARQIALGLSALHERGIVHRDLKASNVMIAGARIKMTDLGILLLEGNDATRLTSASHVLGTRAYMAPEQLEDPRSVTSAADLYALGVVMFALISGRLPELPLRAPPGPLASLIQRLLDPDPTKRPTAIEVSELLTAPKRRRRWPGLVALAAASIAGLLLIDREAPPVQTPAIVPQQVIVPPPVTVPPVVESPTAIEVERAEALEVDPPKTRAPKRKRRVQVERAEAPRVEAKIEPPKALVEAPPPRIDATDVERRLVRTFEQLRAAASSMPPRELEPLEASYLSLRRALAAAETDGEIERVAREVHDLEREVRRVIDQDKLDR